MKTENLKVVTYEGILGIERADGIKTQLMNLIDQGNSILVNLSRIEWIDLSIVQVLVSAKKTAIAKQIDLSFINLVSEAALKAFYTSGIIRGLQVNGQDLGVAIADYVQGNR